MSAPLGNTNAAKAKQWAAAIERALERIGDPSINPDVPLERAPKAKALDALADAFVAPLKRGPTGEKGDPYPTLIREFGDRLDGRAAQQIQLGGDPDGVPIAQRIEQVIVDAKE